MWTAFVLLDWMNGIVIGGWVEDFWRSGGAEVVEWVSHRIIKCSVCVHYCCSMGTRLRLQWEHKWGHSASQSVSQQNIVGLTRQRWYCMYVADWWWHIHTPRTNIGDNREHEERKRSGIWWQRERERERKWELSTRPVLFIGRIIDHYPGKQNK